MANMPCRWADLHAVPPGTLTTWSFNGVERGPSLPTRMLSVTCLQVREKQGTWRLASDDTPVAHRRRARNDRHPGNPPPEPIPSSSLGGGDGVGGRKHFLGSAVPPPSRWAGKTGVSPPPPITIPHALSLRDASQAPQERITEKDSRGSSVYPSGSRQDGGQAHTGFATAATAGVAEQKEEEQKAWGESGREGDPSDRDSGDIQRHGSMVSRRSHRSFMSARSFVSNDMDTGDDGFEEPNGDTNAANRGSESDSDSDNFFDAVAVDGEIDGGAMCGGRHGRQSN